MRKFETIKVNINGKINSAQINTEENSVLRAKCGGGDNPHKPTEFALDLKNNRIYCKKCGREFRIVEKSWVKRAEAEAEAKAKAEKIAPLIEKRDILDEQINKCFDLSEEKRQMSDAEASRNMKLKMTSTMFYNVTDEEIMLIQDFSDFTSGIAIPYNEKIAEWVKEVVELQKAILTV